MTAFRPVVLAFALAGAIAAPTGAQTPAIEAPAAQGAAAPGSATSPAAGTAGQADASAAMLEALSPLIADVQVVGPWSEGDRTGIWRTITLQPQGEGAGNRFFVQQIEEQDGAPAVTSSIEIAEIAEMAGALIGYRADPPSEAQPELLTLFLDMVPLDGELAETYELFLTTAEPYVFGPASN